jgi:hypothetical protein
MFKRIGHVIGWIGDTVGALFVVAGVANYFQLYERIAGKLSGHEYAYDPVLVAELNFLVTNNVQHVDDLRGDMLRQYHWAESAARQTEIEKLLIMLAIGIAIFLFCRALRYIVAG